MSAVRQMPKLVASRDPAREALAKAIGDAAGSRSKRSEASAARQRLNATAADARHRLRIASDAAEDAREAHGVAVIAAAKAGTEPPVSAALRKARQHEVDARDDLEVAESAIKALAQEEASHAAEFARAEKRVEDAARDVILAALSDAQEVVREAKRELGRRVAVARFVTRLMPYKHSYDEAAPKRAAESFLPDDIGDDVASMNAVQPWEAARLALLNDANAPLPNLGGV